MIDSLKMIPDFHFFSDTEVTNSTANDSRSGSPTHVESVQSDSEIEVKKMKGKFYKPLLWQSNYIFLEDVQSSKNWEWGGFPSVSETTSPTSENPTKEEQKSMLSGMFSFMKQKHSAQNQFMEGGRYLSEITNNIDPEVTEIYFNKRAGKIIFKIMFVVIILIQRQCPAVRLIFWGTEGHCTHIY